MSKNATYLDLVASEQVRRYATLHNNRPRHLRLEAFVHVHGPGVSAVMRPLQEGMPQGQADSAVSFIECKISNPCLFICRIRLGALILPHRPQMVRRSQPVPDSPRKTRLK